MTSLLEIFFNWNKILNFLFLINQNSIVNKFQNNLVFLLFEGNDQFAITIFLCRYYVLEINNVTKYCQRQSLSSFIISSSNIHTCIIIMDWHLTWHNNTNVAQEGINQDLSDKKRWSRNQESVLNWLFWQTDKWIQVICLSFFLQYRLNFIWQNGSVQLVELTSKAIIHKHKSMEKY